MSFSLRSLSVLAYANGFTLWHYKAGSDDLPGIARPGYFNDAADMLAGGDMVMVSAPGASRILCIAVEAGQVLAAPLA